MPLRRAVFFCKYFSPAHGSLTSYSKRNLTFSDIAAVFLWPRIFMASTSTSWLEDRMLKQVNARFDRLVAKQQNQD